MINTISIFMAWFLDEGKMCVENFADKGDRIYFKLKDFENGKKYLVSVSKAIFEKAANKWSWEAIFRYDVADDIKFEGILNMKSNLLFCMENSYIEKADDADKIYNKILDAFNAYYDEYEEAEEDDYNNM